MGPSLPARLPQDQPHVPDDWAVAAARVSDGATRRAMVIGGADVGKSTLCRLLIGDAQRAGRNPALLDTDLGQKTVGPPACVTLAEAHAVRLAFVGTTNPIHGRGPLIEGARRMAEASRADLLIANTSGVLAGLGRHLKTAKIAAIQPDLLIAVGTGTDLETILMDHAHVAILRLKPSPETRRKTKAERRAARRQAFRRYFAGASSLVLDRADVDLRGTVFGPQGLLLGLVDESGSDVGIGIVVGYPTALTIEILTPVAGANIRRITPGSLCLDRSFSEWRPPLPPPWRLPAQM